MPVVVDKGEIHPLARFAYFKGANSPWEQRKESNLLLKDNETRDLTVCPLCYVVASERFERCLLVMGQMSYLCSTLAI